MPMQPIPPPLTEPDEPRCVCISVNESWAVLLLGAVHKMQYPDYWGGSLEENRLARRQAKNLMAIISEAIQMGCCCDDAQTPRRERYTSDGLLEISTDGGQTWQPGDDFDPRFSGPLFPPLQGADGDDKRCKAATNILEEFKDRQTKLANDSSAWAGIEGLIAAIMGLLVFFAIIGTAGAATPIIIGVAAALHAAGNAAFIAAFTPAVWEDLHCLIYCALSPDGTITKENWILLKEQIRSAFAGVAGIYLAGLVDTLGPVGLANVAATEHGETGDCSPCNCGDGWCAKWYVGGPLQFIYSAFIAIDSIGVPPNPFEWNGNTVYEYKIGATVPNRLITQVTVEFQNSAAGVQGAAWNDSDFSPFPGYAAASIAGNKVTFPVNTFCNQGLVILIESNSNPGHIVSVTVEGEDTNPYGEDNC